MPSFGTRVRATRIGWSLFDESRLQRLILKAPGWHVQGAVDLSVDRAATRPGMRDFHGYPYTSVGIALLKS